LLNRLIRSVLLGKDLSGEVCQPVPDELLVPSLRVSWITERSEGLIRASSDITDRIEESSIKVKEDRFVGSASHSGIVTGLGGGEKGGWALGVTVTMKGGVQSARGLSFMKRKQVRLQGEKKN